MTTTANDPVCRVCGSDDLAAVEQAVSWRRVNFVPDGKGRWVTGDEWASDDVGDQSSETIGVACTDCNTETEGDAGQLITTRAAYNRAHPLRPWWVIVERLHADRTARDRSKRRVSARGPRDAIEKANESGMVQGQYPWRVPYYMGYDSAVPSHLVWPVGTPQPADPTKAAA